MPRHAQLLVVTTPAAVPEKLTGAQKERWRSLVVPREHGAWGMLLVPLVAGGVIGLEAGGNVASVLLLTVAVLALFWLRTPAESWLGTGVVRAQTPQERRHAAKFIVLLTSIAALSMTALLWQGRVRQLFLLAGLAAVAFAGQFYLKKLGRSTRMISELVGAIVLTATAPAAYCAATGRLDMRAWFLWLLNWMFAANQVHFVWLTIRGARASGWSEKLSVGWSFMAGQFLLAGVLILTNHYGWLPALALAAFVPALFRGCAWFAKRPQPIVLRRLGWTEMAHAIAFGVILIAAYSLRI